ncbi:MAG: histidine phosphatase family protein [Candidatus Micrarchaeaceae archaeon]
MSFVSERARLILVRHGETNANKSFIVQGQMDWPLNDKGRRQAETVAERLSGIKIDRAFTSPLSRALDTAKEIMKHHPGAPLILEERLKEMYAGRNEGREFSSKKEVYEYAMLRAEEAGGETLEGFQRRVYSFLRDAALSNPGKTILVVSHGGTSMALFNALRRKPASEMLNIEPPANTEVTELDVLLRLLRK